MRAALISRWAGTAHRLGVTLFGATITALAGLLVNGCDSIVQPFQCGVRLGSDSAVARSCDGPNEVCICWTHYCARQQSPDHVPTEPNHCPSGFRYRLDPFGPPLSDNPATTEPGDDAGVTTPAVAIDSDLGGCVPPELVEWKVANTQLCEDSEHAPNIFQKDDGPGADAGTDADTDAGDGGETPDGGGGTGGTSSTSTTSGGAGGTGGSGGSGGAGGTGGTATGGTGGSQ